MKILSALKFITILGLSTIILLGCVRKQPEPVARKNKHVTSDGKYIGSGGYAIDLREMEIDDKRYACMEQLQYYSGDAKIKKLEQCNEIGK